MNEPKKIYQTTVYEREDGAVIRVRTEVTNSPLPITGEFTGHASMTVKTPMGPQVIPIPPFKIEAADLKEAFDKFPDEAQKSADAWKQEQEAAQFKAKLSGK